MKKVVPLRAGIDDGEVTSDAVVSPVADTLSSDAFETLLALGRLNDGLTQDDVVSVLRSVELSPDLITGVVERIRAAGIEFTYDSGETTIVPLTRPPVAAVIPEP